jgi:hypothetical protein
MKFTEYLKEDSSTNEATKPKNLKRAEKFDAECQKVVDEIAKLANKIGGLFATAKSIGLDDDVRKSAALAGKSFKIADDSLDDVASAVSAFGIDAIFYHEGDDVSEGSEKKSKSASKVLQLMDQDYEYQDALKMVVKSDKIKDVKAFEKELDIYV